MTHAQLSAQMTSPELIEWKALAFIQAEEATRGGLDAAAAATLSRLKGK